MRTGRGGGSKQEACVERIPGGEAIVFSEKLQAEVTVPRVVGCVEDNHSEQWTCSTPKVWDSKDLGLYPEVLQDVGWESRGWACVLGRYDGGRMGATGHTGNSHTGKGQIQGRLPI